MECKTCNSLSGKKRISPGQQIYSGNYWVIEHAYPTSIKGWLVLVLKRHVETLHELTDSELSEMFVLQSKIIRVLHHIFNSKKEYMAAFAEAPGFEHVHIHFIPKDGNFPEKFKGSKAFNLIGKIDNPLPEDLVIELCQELGKLF